MLKRSVRIELESVINELQVNLENNYKDLAQDALKELHATLEENLATGKMKEKDYNKYKKIADDDYSAKMANYHH
mgnify:CR=1 FL=1